MSVSLHSQSPQHVVWCSWRDESHPRAGGAEVYTGNVLRAWAQAGHEVTLVSAAVPGAPAREEREGIIHVRAGGRLGVYRRARRWVESLPAGRVDVLVDEINTVPFHTPRWALRAHPAARVVAFAHQTCEDIWPYEAPWPLHVLGQRLLEPRWLAAYAHQPVIVPSASTAAALRRFGVRDVRVVAEGVELDQQAGRALLSTGKAALPTVVFCGRLVPSKRPLEALRAFQHARRAEPALREAQMHFIGGGPLEDELRRHAGDSAVTGVHVRGRVGEAEKWATIASAHVLVATSVREGWGLVVSEAAALGALPVGYDVPGLRDSLAAAGGIITPCDPASLAQTLVRVLPALRSSPFSPLPHGGALGWEQVAAQVWGAVHAQQWDESQNHRTLRPPYDPAATPSGAEGAPAAQLPHSPTLAEELL